MMTTLNAHNWRTFLPWSAMSRAWRLLKFGCLGGFLFLASETLGFKAVLMGAGLGLAVFLVFTWKASRARDIRLENFTADLTSAVYSVVLRRGLRDSWLKAELDLWKAFEDTVKVW